MSSLLKDIWEKGWRKTDTRQKVFPVISSVRTETADWAIAGRKNCKKYPYTDQPDRWASLYSVLDVIEVCPVAFEIYERLKEEYGWRYRIDIRIGKNEIIFL